MSDTINIPVELLDDLIKVNKKIVDINNRLKACSNRSSANKWAAETSLKEGRHAPKPPSKKTLLVQRAKKEIRKIKERN